MTNPTLESDFQEDESFGLDDETVNKVLEAVRNGDTAALSALIDPLHAADVADILEQIDPSTRRAFVQIWGSGIDGEILSELDEGLREEVIDALTPADLAEAVRDLESDDVVDLLEDLEKPHQDAVLDALDDSDRVAAERALSYPEESAGRLMQREVVMGPEHWNVGQAIDFLRNNDDLPEQFYHMVLVDPRLRPVGYVTLGKLLSAPRKTPLVDLVEDSFRTFSATAPEEDVAYAFNQYHLISAPVTDEDDRLVGIITIDDAMAVLDEENEEDILRLAGVGEESLSDRIWETAKSRAPWLTVNLGTAILASAVIALFEGAIAKIVALAVLMPIVASMGGNAGTQSLTVVVRALATKDLTSRNTWRVLRREALAGLINGLFFALLMGGVVYFWYGDIALGGILAAAMVINLVVAGGVGVGVPVLLEKAGVDPALASGTFVTTVTDVAGFFVFLGLASMILL